MHNTLIDPATLARHLGEPGWVVLTGGMTDAVFAPPGSSVAVHFTNLGSCFINGGEQP